ncbi:MAG: hypothetical protein RL518_1682 [Pseudomonadota bacterium]|jgi:hypothetical protein
MHHTTQHTRTILATSNQSTTNGTMEVLEFSEQGRVKRAWLTALKCLGATALCVLIPGAHFVLVPLGLLVVTPLMTVYTLRVKTKIVSASIDCPACHKPLNVLTSQERYPIYENCSSCHRQVTLTQGV